MVTCSAKNAKEKESEISLHFKDKTDFDFFDHRKGYFVSAFLHNNDTRVTIVKHGHGSLTFEEHIDDEGEPTM